MAGDINLTSLVGKIKQVATVAHEVTSAGAITQTAAGLFKAAASGKMTLNAGGTLNHQAAGLIKLASSLIHEAGPLSAIIGQIMSISSMMSKLTSAKSLLGSVGNLTSLTSSIASQMGSMTSIASGFSSIASVADGLSALNSLTAPLTSINGSLTSMVSKVEDTIAALGGVHEASGTLGGVSSLKTFEPVATSTAALSSVSGLSGFSSLSTIYDQLIEVTNTVNSIQLVQGAILDGASEGASVTLQAVKDALEDIHTLSGGLGALLPDFLQYTITIGGAWNTGDTIDVSFSGALLNSGTPVVASYSSTGLLADSTIATKTKEAINDHPLLQAANITATSVGAVVTVSVPTALGVVALGIELGDEVNTTAVLDDISTGALYLSTNKITLMIGDADTHLTDIIDFLEALP